jgi:hypothetical protein
MEKIRNVYTISVGNPEGKETLNDIGVNERLILKQVLMK